MSLFEAENQPLVILLCQNKIFYILFMVQATVVFITSNFFKSEAHGLALCCILARKHWNSLKNYVGTNAQAYFSDASMANKIFITLMLIVNSIKLEN
jgi:hypothetical protein